MTARRVIVVGGGISGLSAAEAILHRSAAAGTPVSVRVFEEGDSPGGKINSHRDPSGFVVDTGPHGFLDKEPKMFALIDRLGLNDRLIAANTESAKRFIVRKGRLMELPTSPPKFLMSGVLPFFSRLRVGFEPFASARPPQEESVWQFAARRMGPRAADILIDAMVTGIYGGDPKELSLRSAFPRMFELESEYGSLIKAQVAIAKERKRLGIEAPAPTGAPTGTIHSFKDGLGEVIGALADHVGVQTKTAVDAVTRTDQGFSVSVDGQTADADAVVFAIPARPTARLLRPLMASAADAAEAIPYADVAVVLHGFKRSDVAHALDGFGFLIPNEEGHEVLGSIWASTVFPEHAPGETAFFRSILGGVRHPELAEGDDETLLARARGELAKIVGISAAAPPVFHHIIRWPRGIPQYTIGHQGRVEATARVETEVPGIFVIGNAFRGVSMLNCVAAADTAAERTLQFLRAAESG